jgi:hypothetical protein
LSLNSDCSSSVASQKESEKEDMNRFLGFTLLSVIGLIAGLPASSRSPTSQSGEPDECTKECINGVIQYGSDLSILKHSDLSNYFNKIDEICEVISTARKCLESCSTTTSNPFALESLNIVCQKETQEKIDSIKQCLHYIDSNVNEICTKECGNDKIIDETDVTPSKVEEENPMIKKANGDCATFKCMARCNIEVVSNQCGKDLGKEFQGLLQQVLNAQRRDLEGLKLVDTMAKTSPPECNYLYDPNVLFGSSNVEESSSPAPHDPKEDVKTLYAQAQLQLLLKQLELAEKQDQLIDRENAKLDMEMSYMAHKAELREHRFHAAAAHSIPTFVPIEKVPEPYMPTEPHPPMEEGSHHQEQQQQPQVAHPEMESHPPMEEAHPHEPEHPEQSQMESHPPMEEFQPQQQPEESHPPMPMEESHAHSSMEPHPSAMPMEAHPPMDFPHPESMHQMPPMEMNPDMPKQKSSRHSMPPIILEGVPMEFVPMDGIPIELPMHLPMEAMPRFL